MGKNFAVIGGDLRNISLAKKLIGDGANVKLYGFGNYAGNEIKQSGSLKEALKNVEYVMGGIPCSHDKETLNTPLNNELIYMHELFKSMNENQLFFAGRISPSLLELAKSNKIRAYDIYEMESLATLNGIPTAEGAIKIAIEETDFTLHGSRVLILGYGRIGKPLSKMLQGFSADVYVGVYKTDAYAAVRSMGCKAVYTDSLREYLPEMDIIFNTVPKVLLDETNLKLLRPGRLIIDMASKPFGVDYESSKRLGVKVLWAPSLPGKIAPDTAADYIKETIYEIIRGER